MRRNGGAIRITGRVEGSLLKLDVAATGPGIPPEIHDRLFEPFVTRRADADASASNPERKGTGLGLCICRDLVRQAGGSITVEYVFSYPGLGLLTVEAIDKRDFPLLQAIFMLLTLSVIFFNLLVDLAYARLDPRVRGRG